MKHLRLRFLIVVIAACLVVSVVDQYRTVRGQTSQATPEEWKATEQAIGKIGSLQPGSVFKIGLPRTDLLVKVHGVVINPMLALGSWIAFKKMGNEAVVMGDLVLSEDEVGPVMWSLQESGIEQSALHNHVFDESPRVMYMHVHGRGDAPQLAAGDPSRPFLHKDSTWLTVRPNSKERHYAGDRFLTDRTDFGPIGQGE